MEASQQAVGIKVNGHTLRISVRDILQVGVTAVAIVGIYFLSSNRLGNLESSVGVLYKKYDEQEKYLNKMDEGGTRRSHEKDETQQQMIDYNSSQINDLNKQMRDIAPKVDKIDTNVLWLMTKQLERK